MTLSLHKAISNYFAASNAHDAAAVAQTFAVDGVVHDEGKTHRGRAEIGAWARDAIKKYHTTMTPLGVSGGDRSAAVNTKVSGTFPGSPIELTFDFELGDDGIRSLKIG
jgi:hypothetical protein